MQISHFLEDLQSLIRGNKELEKAYEEFLFNHIIFDDFVDKNPGVINKVRSIDVIQTLQKSLISLQRKRVNIDVIKNIFDEYTLIYLISALSWGGKGLRAFDSVLANTEKFTIYTRPNKNLKVLVSRNDRVIEFYWLIPLLRNNNIVNYATASEFIKNFESIHKRDSSFVDGYFDFVVNFSKFNAEDYKQYLLQYS